MDKTTHTPYHLTWKALSRHQRFYYDFIFTPALSSFWYSCVVWYQLHNTPPIEAENRFWSSIIPHSPSIVNFIGIRELTAGIERAAMEVIK